MNETSWPTCSEPECEKPCKNSAGRPRPRCSKHEKDRETAKNRLKECDVVGCDKRRTQARRYCGGHMSRLTRWGDLMADVPLRTMSDEPNGYAAAHERVYKTKGPASAQICFVCGGQAQQWAYQHWSPNEVTGPVPSRGKVWTATWSTDPDDYEAMCRTCHLRMDAAIRSVEK